MTESARSAEQRYEDTILRLETDVDAWVATADPATGSPYLVPLSFLWDGELLIVSTASSNPTGRNLLRSGEVHLGIGLVCDVVLIQGTATPIASAEIPASIGDAFAVKCGFDPRTITASYHYFRIVPQRIQAWREVNELAGRDIMLDGRWLVPDVTQ